MQQPAVAALIAVLEQSQTQRDVNVDDLFKHLTPVEAVIDDPRGISPQARQQLASALCSWLRAHEDFPDSVCVRVLLRILAKLLGQDPTVDGIAVQKGLLSSATSLLSKHTDDSLMMRCCLEVLATLSVVENSDQILSRLKTVSVVVELLRKHRDNSAVLEDAITTLALMAKRTRHRRSLQQCGGVKALVEVLKRCVSTPPLVVASSRFLTNFAVKEDCCIEVLQSGGVDALMAAFDSLAAQKGAAVAVDTRAVVATAIWTCCTDCTDVQQVLLQAGWLSSLAAVLQATPNHATLHEAALGIARCLSRNANHREDIIGLGFANSAVEAMHRFPDNTLVLKEACGVFGNLATDPEIRVQLGESGVIQEVVAVLARCRRYDDRKVAKLALGALSNLSSCDENRGVMAAANAGSVLLEAARTFMGNENILESAVIAISHIAMHEGCFRQLVDAGAVEALLLFLGDHRDDLQIVLKSVVALRRLMKQSLISGGSGDTTVTGTILHAGRAEGCNGVYILLNALQDHMYDATVVKESALLLTGLARIQDAVPVLVAAAVDPCMKALEVHQNEAVVTEAIGGLLGCLPIEEDANWVKEGLVGGSSETLDVGALRPQAAPSPKATAKFAPLTRVP